MEHAEKWVNAFADGDYEDCYENAHLALEENPGDLWALFLSGMCAKEFGWHREAIEKLTRCLPACDSYLLRITRGASYCLIMDFEAAVADYRVAVRFRPGDEFPLIVCGHALLLIEGRSAEALEFMRRAIAVSKTPTPYIHMLGMLAVLQQDEERRRVGEEAALRFPDHERFREFGTGSTLTPDERLQSDLSELAS